MYVTVNSIVKERRDFLLLYSSEPGANHTLVKSPPPSLGSSSGKACCLFTLNTEKERGRERKRGRDTEREREREAERYRGKGGREEKREREGGKERRGEGRGWRRQ